MSPAPTRERLGSYSVSPKLWVKGTDGTLTSNKDKTPKDTPAEAPKDADDNAEVIGVAEPVESEDTDRTTAAEEELAEGLAELEEIELELPPVFERFLQHLRERDPGLDGLEPPAKDGDIEEAEERLGISFPPLFQQFLNNWNGGTAHEICIYGVGTHDEFDIVDFNERARREDLPSEFVGFASTIAGDIFCFHRDEEQGEGEFLITLYDIENGQVLEAAQSFAEWLDGLPFLEADEEELHQPQPMSIEEWEAFLERERANLRRLAKTPAREIFMPDPEAIRAELGNKIPVDPRHLKPKA